MLLKGHSRRRVRFSALEVLLLGQIYTHFNYRSDKLGTEYIVQHLAYLHGYMSRLNLFPIQKRKQTVKDSKFRKPSPALLQLAPLADPDVFLSTRPASQ